MPIDRAGAGDSGDVRHRKARSDPRLQHLATASATSSTVFGGVTGRHRHIALKANTAFEPIKIVGVLADEVGKPLNDGTQGSALYAVPFKLSRAPTHEWSDLFVRTWDRPPRWTTSHFHKYTER